MRNMARKDERERLERMGTRESKKMWSERQGKGVKREESHLEWEGIKLLVSSAFCSSKLVWKKAELDRSSLVSFILRKRRNSSFLALLVSHVSNIVPARCHMVTAVRVNSRFHSLLKIMRKNYTSIFSLHLEKPSLHSSSSMFICSFKVVFPPALVACVPYLSS